MPMSCPGATRQTTVPASNDRCADRQCDPVNLFHPLMFFRAVIIADDRAHSLHDAVDRKIKESLKFIIDSQNHHIDLSVTLPESR